MTLDALWARPLGLAEEVSAFLPSRSRVAVERVVAALQAARFAWRPRPIVALVGLSRVDGSRLRVVTDLRGEALGYWSGLLFDGTPASAPLGVAPVRERLARRADADLVLMTHHRAFRRRARAAGWLTVPSWLDTGIPLAGSLAATLDAQPQGRRSRQSDLRRIRRARLEPSIVRDGGAVREFLRDWYLPFVHARWGETCVALDAAWRRRAERYCEVLWVRRGAERVAGVLLEDQGRALRMVVVGMVDPANRRDGALAAAYHFALAEAVGRGRAWLGTGGTRPVLSDGVLDFKRKWGAHVRRVRQEAYLALACAGWAPTLRALFARHPVVAEAADGEFLACTTREALASPPSEAARAMFELGGLAGALVAAEDGWARASLHADATPADGDRTSRAMPLTPSAADRGSGTARPRPDAPS